MAPSSPVEQSEKTLKSYAYAWGKSSFPPTLLATFVTALHLRPLQPLPMIFPPVLLFSTYLNLSGFKRDSAGITAAWSGLYMLLASRRKLGLKKKFTAKGVVRGMAIGTAGINLVSCGMVYALEKREKKVDGESGL